MHCTAKIGWHITVPYQRKIDMGKEKGKDVITKFHKVILHKIYTIKQFIHEKLTSFQQNKKINKNTIAIYNNKYRHM